MLVVCVVDTKSGVLCEWVCGGVRVLVGGMVRGLDIVLLFFGVNGLE